MFKYKVVLQFNDGNVEFTKENGLKGFSLLSQLTSNNALPSFELNGRFGTLDITDDRNLLYEKIINRIYPQNVKIYLENTLIGEFISAKKYSYNIFTKDLSIQITGNIVNLQNVMIEKKDIEYNVSGYYVLQYLMNAANNPNNLYSFTIPEDTQWWLESIKIPFFYLEKASLWDQFKKVCESMLLCIYQDKYNNIVIKRIIK